MLITPSLRGVALNVVPNPIVSGRALRGHPISALGLNGFSLQWQERATSNGTWTNVSQSSTFTLGSVNVGREYRVVTSKGGVAYNSAGFGPIGISDTILPSSNAYRSVGQDIVNINTDGVGKNVGFVRDVDYRTTISFYEGDFSSNARISYRVGAGVGGLPGQVFCYAFFARNRYTDDTASSPFSAGVAHSQLSTQPMSWSLAEDTTAGMGTEWSHLIEYFPSDNANLVAPAVSGVGGNRQQELGLLPKLSDAARNYFTTGVTNGAPTVYPDYVDENGLTWVVRSKAGPGIILSGRRYLVAFPPVGVQRLTGTFRWDRYINWLIAQDATKGAWFMTGIASGMEVGTSATLNEGAVVGKWLPSTVEYPWSGVAAAAYTFDTDVAAYYARFSNLPGIEVRKAVDAFIVALKAASLYSLLDTIYLPRSAGLVDMRREFKSASRDIVDRLGTASYVSKQGLTYAGLGYGGTQFNPATAGGQFAQDSAFAFVFIESVTTNISAAIIGNAGVRIGCTGSGGVSHQLNNVSTGFGGVVSPPEGYSIRRIAGAGPAGTGGSTGYQVKRTGSTVSVFDATATSAALTSAEIEIARNGSGTIYSNAAISGMMLGGGMTNTQVDTLHAAYLTLRTALANAGV